MLTVTTTFDAGVLTVTSDDADGISVGTDSGNVTVNADADPAGTGAIAASTVTSIVITGGDGANAIDVTGVTQAEFTALASVSIDTGAGDDSVDGSEFDDAVQGGSGNDTLNGMSGADTLEGGYGDDELVGGSGADTIFGDRDSAIDVDINTNFGTIQFELTPDAAPQTVDNFLAYVRDGDYANAFFHRYARLGDGTDFVLQGGGFTTPSTTFTDISQFQSVPQNDPVQNEFNQSNVRGTVAMAKLGSDPNSATNQFFVNLEDNGPILDGQNGGFTVFAEVTDMTVVDDIVAMLSTLAEPSPYGELPVVSGDQLVVIQSVEAAGNDTIIWNDGDGSDIVDGGVGNDLQTVNSSTENDVFEIIAGTGGATRFDRTSGTAFSLDVSETETLTVNADDGDDSVTVADLTDVAFLTTLNLNGEVGDDDFTVAPTTGLTINVDGGSPILGIGDRLTFAESGTVTVDNIMTRTGSVENATGTVDFTNIEDVQTADARTLTVSDLELAESDVGQSVFRFTITLSNAQTQDVNFEIDTADGTATVADGDYDALTDEIVQFLPGTTVQTVDVLVNGDISPEDSETFQVIPSNVNAEAGPITLLPGTGTIINDDGLVEVIVDGDGNLNIQDLDGTDDDITVVRDSGTNEFVITSPIAQLSDGSGNLMTEVRIAAADVTGGLNADLGAGNDSLTADTISLRSTVLGGDGNDVIRTGSGRDSVDGGPGDDEIVSGGDNDTLRGEAGNDTLTGGGGRDSVFGGADDDLLRGNSGADTLDGGAGIDALDGDSGANLIIDQIDVSATITDAGITGAGGDSASGTLAVVSLTGGAGDDSFNATGFTGLLTLDGDEGNDTLVGGVNADTLIGGVGEDLLRGLAGDDSLTGNDGNDRLFGNGGRDLLLGNAGDDDLFGSGGVDTLNGGEGIDHLDGGASFSTIIDQLEGTAVITEMGYSTARGDTATGRLARVDLLGGDGDDRFDAAGINVGNISLNGGAGNDTLVGGRLNDILIGGEGDDTIRGARGRDSIFGESGNDNIKGQGGIDVLSGGLGNDRIDGGSSNTFLRENVEGDTTLQTTADGTVLTGIGTDRLFGTFKGALLIAGDIGIEIDASAFDGGAVTIIGGAGADRLTGTRFNDVISAGDGDDTVVGNVGHDAIDGGAGDDSISGNGGNDTLLGGEGDDTLRGGGLIDRILGEEGDDTIDGGLLVDKVTGGGNGVAASDGDTIAGDIDQIDDAFRFRFEKLLPPL